MDYAIGDVVIAYLLFEDGKGGKWRPAIIFHHNKEKGFYVVAECYSDKEHYDGKKGILIKEDTDIFREMGLDVDSFITPSIKAVYERLVRKKIGVYLGVEELKNKYRK